MKLDPISNRRLLLQIAAIQAWRRPGCSNLNLKNWYQVLFSKNRQVTIRLIRKWKCFACGAGLAEGSTGDHLIALAEGGSDSIENFSPLCQPCNSSKGKIDLLVWWHTRGRKLNELSPDVLCAYARLRFAFLHDSVRSDGLDSRASDEAVFLISETMENLSYVQQSILLDIGGTKADYKERE